MNDLIQNVNFRYGEENHTIQCHITYLQHILTVRRGDDCNITYATKTQPGKNPFADFVRQFIIAASNEADLGIIRHVCHSSFTLRLTTSEDGDLKSCFYD